MQDRIRDDFDECGPGDVGLLDWSEVAFTPLDPDDERERKFGGLIGGVLLCLVFWVVVVWWWAT